MTSFNNEILLRTLPYTVHTGFYYKKDLFVKKLNILIETKFDSKKVVGGRYKIAEIVPGEVIHVSYGAGLMWGLFLLKYPAIGSHAGLETGPEPHAPGLHVCSEHAEPLTLHGGLHVVQVGVVHIVGMDAHLASRLTFEFVQHELEQLKPLLPLCRGQLLGLDLCQCWERSRTSVNSSRSQP